VLYSNELLLHLLLYKSSSANSDTLVVFQGRGSRGGERFALPLIVARHMTRLTSSAVNDCATPTVGRRMLFRGDLLQTNVCTVSINLVNAGRSLKPAFHKGNHLLTVVETLTYSSSEFLDGKTSGRHTSVAAPIYSAYFVL